MFEFKFVGHSSVAIATKENIRKNKTIEMNPKNLKM